MLLTHNNEEKTDPNELAVEEAQNKRGHRSDRKSVGIRKHTQIVYHLITIIIAGHLFYHVD